MKNIFEKKVKLTTKEIQEKLKNMKNYDLWLYFLDNFEELKQLEWIDLEKKRAYRIDPNRTIQEIKRLIYEYIESNEQYINDLDIILPVLVEKDPNKKLHKFFEYLLLFPDSDEWEDQIFSLFWWLDYRFDYLWYLLPRNDIVVRILNILWDLQEDWYRIIWDSSLNNWKRIPWVLAFWWQIRKAVEELRKINEPDMKDLVRSLVKYMIKETEYNEEVIDNYYNK